MTIDDGKYGHILQIAEWKTHKRDIDLEWGWRMLCLLPTVQCELAI